MLAVGSLLAFAGMAGTTVAELCGAELRLQLDGRAELGNLGGRGCRILARKGRHLAAHSAVHRDAWAA